ncbi:MAG: PepSY domain-containing protein [Rhodopseudomonas palustris]|uniref:PepSY domain-containing protein n=1 Tax=Rhodopseudomonas palustris TaxID=1076 RepID=A0A933RTA9_RHOPL|nr:PepSY domain-containing protein [Rhodopseudomonas palustris]
MMRFRPLLAGLMLAVIAGGASAHDHGSDRDRGRHDHDEARLAVQRGEIRPLAELLTMVRGKLPGEITGVEIERHHGQWLYEFIVVDKNGRLFEVYVDPQSGEIRKTKEK